MMTNKSEMDRFLGFPVFPSMIDLQALEGRVPLLGVLISELFMYNIW